MRRKQGQAADGHWPGHQAPDKSGGGYWAIINLLEIEILLDTLLPPSKYVTTWPWPLLAITSSQSRFELTVYGNNIPGSMPEVS